MKTKLSAGSAGVGLISALWCASALAEPMVQPRLETQGIGTRQDPLISDETVSIKRQRQLGLVTVGGGCSGTLINRYWVLTANHCVASNPKIFGSPDAPFANARVTATWTSKTATPTRYVRYFNSNGLDVALVFLGAGDLGPVDRKLIYHNDVDTSMTLTKFGRGICAYAQAGPPAQPAQTNCGYRTAVFAPSTANASVIVLPVNDRGQIGNGGDSGGPDYVTDGDGNLLSIASVQSRCGGAFMVPSMAPADGSVDWNWVTSIRDCTSVPLITLRDDIHRRMAEAPPLIAAAPPAGSRDIYRSRGADVAAAPPAGARDIYVARGTGVAPKSKSPYIEAAGTHGDGVLVPEQSTGPSPFGAPSPVEETAPNADAAVKPADGAVAVVKRDVMFAAGPSLAAPTASCKSGFVWRAARPEDLVCVTPEARDRTAQENAAAAGLVDPAGAYGPNTCTSGYVWREAFDGDVVCVTTAVRDIVRQENAEAASHRAGG